MQAPLTVAVLGLGEAGAAIARDLVHAGMQARGWDPVPHGNIQDIPFALSGPAAIAGADVVLSVNMAAVALNVAQSAVDALSPQALYADLNTASPQLKRDVAAIVEANGARFADVALLAPVPGRGLRTPALVSGSGAEAFRDLFTPLGMPVEVAGPNPGDAATKKLLRSVFMKGWASAVIESLEAAHRVGAADWLRQEIDREFMMADESLVTRFIEGSRQHAVRRVEEMVAASELLMDLGITPRIANASADWLRQLAGERAEENAEEA